MCMYRQMSTKAYLGVFMVGYLNNGIVKISRSIKGFEIQEICIFSISTGYYVIY